MIGVTIGTGLGTGIIINKKLYSGLHGGAGEFGMAGYLDKYYEYYACGQFFHNVYGETGESVFLKAQSGNSRALEIYAEMGRHLGNAITTIMYALDPSLIVLGGSVSQAYNYFSEAMWERVQQFAYKRNLEDLAIVVSELEYSGVLGAASLHFDMRGADLFPRENLER
jgi:glucokinase